MSNWSPAIANEFIRLARAKDRGLTQMQLQKLVYLAHGWNLAINRQRLTVDDPQAWDYGPVYGALRQALREYGNRPVAREILNCEYFPGEFDENADEPARADLTVDQRAVINRVYREYGGFHAYKLSALTHQDGTPWTQVYKNGDGRFDEIPADVIRDHFVEIAARR